jgi:hypothetical protein
MWVHQGAPVPFDISLALNPEMTQDGSDEIPGDSSFDSVLCLGILLWFETAKYCEIFCSFF